MQKEKFDTKFQLIWVKNRTVEAQIVFQGPPPPTLLSFAGSLAENWGGLGRLETNLKSKFVPNLILN